MEDSSAIPSIKYNFTPIQQITDLEKDTNIDVIGVVKECGDVAEIVSKTTQRASKKRDIVLADSTGTCITMTLWGNHAVSFNGADAGSAIVAIKGARVSEYQGRSLNLSSSSTLTLNPDVSEAHQLRGWYDQVGSQTNFYSLTTGSAPIGGSAASGGGAAYDRPEHRIVISQILEEQMGHGEKVYYFFFKALM